jgi:D-arabinose 1-dehydrogenase-like Zn-dependent alcohol dehydrogenase
MLDRLRYIAPTHTFDILLWFTQRHLTALFQLLKGKKIHVHVSRRISLAEVADAQARLEKEEFNGAVVCLPWKRTPPRPEGGVAITVYR